MTDATARGIAAIARQDWEAAEIAFGEALDHDPHDAEANLGMAQMAIHAGYPEDVHAFTNMARPKDIRMAQLEFAASLALGKPDKALGDAMEFLNGSNETGEFRFRIGNSLLADERYADALTIFRKGREAEPGNHLMTGGEAAAYFGLGRMGECRRAVEHRMRLLPDDPLVFSQWIGLHAGKPSVDQAGSLAMAVEWDRRFGGAPAERPHVRAEDGRLRVGFVSTTFRHHANCQFLLPLLEAIDRKRFALFAYHDGSHEDDITQRCRAAVDVFRSIHGMPEWKAVEIIRADRIDVLVDINTHFDNARLRLFTHRPAPIQVHYLGGVGTTGLKCMDWRLADELTEPSDRPDSESGTEKIFRMEGGIHAFRPLREAAAPDDLPMLRNGFVTFGCLNALPKMEDEVLELWARCLEAVPGSRLRLVKQLFRHEANRADFSRRAAKRGIDPARLDLVSAEISAFDDLSIYHGIDIALDTFAYNGITTTCEALWMGVPVVNLRGNRFVAREAAAILTRIGRSEWIAGSHDEYVEIIRSLARDPAFLGPIRTSLRNDFMNSPVHDATRLAKQFGRFLEEAVKSLIVRD